MKDLITIERIDDEHCKVILNHSARGELLHRYGKWGRRLVSQCGKPMTNAEAEELKAEVEKAIS